MMVCLKSLPFLFFQFCSLLKCYFNNLHYRSIATIHLKARLFPSSKIINLQQTSSAINVDAKTCILGDLLVFAHSGSIEIGESCYVGENARIWSASKIKIGNRVLISHGVNIHDTDGHPLDKESRHEHFRQIVTVGHPIDNLDIPSSAIYISDDVWIGFNATILKGVTIGKGSIVGASSVVTHNVPDNTIVAGNPARYIRKVSYESI
jgi:acetyltransferase-like isoleucine patch superfamily enzyme